MTDLRTETRLAFWYRLGPDAKGADPTQPLWSVVDGGGTTVGSVSYAHPNLGSIRYQLGDLHSAPVLGVAEKEGLGFATDLSTRLFDATNNQVGLLTDSGVWWGDQQVAKFQARYGDRPFVFDGAWLWGMDDAVVATITQNRPDGVGASLVLDRPAALPEPLATVTLAAALAVHQGLVRATAAAIRGRVHASGRRLSVGEKADLL